MSAQDTDENNKEIIIHAQKQESHAEWLGLVRPIFQSAYKRC